MITAELNAEDSAKLESLVGKTVKAVSYRNEDEGEYCLYFTDGTVANFGASGDDMTWVTFNLGDQNE